MSFDPHVRSRHHSRGFSIVAATFILVVLALLGVFIVTIGEVERSTATAATQGARTYQAAQAGVQWGIHGALNNTAPTCGGAPSTPTTNTFNLAVAGLNGFGVSVVCSYTPHQERSDTYQVFLITSTSTFGTFGNPDYFSRTLQVTVTNAP